MAEKRSYRIVTVFNAKEGMDDKFNDWYSNAHMPQALKVPGMVSGQRFKLASVQREGAQPRWQYLAYYEVETDDLQGVLDETKRREGTPQLVSTDTIAPGGSVMVFEPITESLPGISAGEKPNFRIITLFNANEGRDDDFNTWYDDHITHAMKVPGMGTGQRFKLANEQRAGSNPPYRYLAFYEVGTNDLAGLNKALHGPIKPPGFVGTDTIQPGGQALFFEPITEKMIGN